MQFVQRVTQDFRGMKYIFLPPYSPDFNPIETAFSAIKQYIRRNGDLYRSSMSGSNASAVDVFCQLHEAVYSISPENAASWFRHCGYI
jgi:transposase